MSDAHTWRIVCTGWMPADLHDHRRHGRARLLLPGGMVLTSVAIVRTLGGLRCAFPRRHVRGDERTERSVSFVTEADWEAFSTAAVAAVRRFAPDAIPETTTTTTMPCANPGAGNKEPN